MKRVHADLAPLQESREWMRITASERWKLHSASGTSGWPRRSCPRTNVLLRHSHTSLNCHPKKNGVRHPSATPVFNRSAPARVLRFQINPTAEIQWPWSTPSASCSLRPAGRRQLHHSAVNLSDLNPMSNPILLSTGTGTWHSFLGESGKQNLFMRH